VTSDPPIFWLDSLKEDRLNLSSYTSVYFDGNSPISPDSIIKVSHARFRSVDDLKSDDYENRGWVKLVLASGNNSLSGGFIRFCPEFDTVRAFVMEEGKLALIDELNIGSKASEKYVPAMSNYIPVETGSKGINTYYFLLTGRSAAEMMHIPHAAFSNRRSVFHTYIYQSGWQMMYVGIMLVLSGMSFIYFLSLRERVFWVYSCLVIFLTLYFAIVKDVLAILLNCSASVYSIFNMGVALAGITFFGFYFVALRLEMKKYFSGFYRILLAWTIMTTLYTLLYGILLGKSRMYWNISNTLIVIWLCLLVVGIVQGIIKKRPAAIPLLFSVGLLVVSGLLYTLSTMKVIGYWQTSQHSFQLGSLAFALTLFYTLFSRINQIQVERLNSQLEREKSDKLLFNVLPREVARELKAKGESPARSFDYATVLFTDFKDFTRTSELLSPEDLVHEINVCFKAFDEITSRFDVEKIKTIGDAYMAAAGLDQNTDGAVEMVKAGLEMQRFVKERAEKRKEKGLPYFEMRVGLHTGPIVAGIVGVKKFQYDIWGDTVNTASRMESHGEVGKVNISQSTYDQVKEFFRCTPREPIIVKGKGSMTMYFVEG
jgi:class 3 adenylate cyclase